MPAIQDLNLICKSCSHRRGTACAMTGNQVAAMQEAVECPAGLFPENPVAENSGDYGLVSASPKNRVGERTGKPRVGFVYPCWQPLGGVERHTMTLVRNCPDVEWAGLVAMLPSQTNLDALQSLNRIIPAATASGLERLKQRSDILIVWGFVGGAPWLSDYRGKVVSITHGEGKWSTDQARSMLPYAKCCVAVCESGKACYPEKLRRDIEVIHNGIAFDRLASSGGKAECRARLGLDVDALIIGSVGRISEEKNPLAAARIAQQIGGRAIALYVGDFTHQPKIADSFMAAARKIAPGRVIWIRDADPEHLGDYYRALDVLLMASSREGGPLVSAEAMFCGVPVVTTPVGMIPDLEAVHGPLTWSMPLKADPLMMAATVCEAIEGDERIQRARNVAVDVLSARRMAAKWGKLLTEM